MANDLACKHGLLRRSCDHCGLEGEITELKERIAALETVASRCRVVVEWACKEARMPLRKSIYKVLKELDNLGIKEPRNE